MSLWAGCAGGAASGGSGLETGGLQRKQKPVRAVVRAGGGGGQGEAVRGSLAPVSPGHSSPKSRDEEGRPRPLFWLSWE